MSPPLLQFPLIDPFLQLPQALPWHETEPHDDSPVHWPLTQDLCMPMPLPLLEQEVAPTLQALGEPRQPLPSSVQP